MSLIQTEPNIVNPNQSKTAPKWHRIYYLLALFDVIIVIFGLFLNHQIINIQTFSVEENQAWSRRLENYLELIEFGAAVNAPGNDVFDSQDFLGESKKMESALALFDNNMRSHYESLDKEIPVEYQAKLRENFDKIDLSMKEMTKESRTIFSHFENRRPDLAGHRMAEMDRKYFRFNQSLTDLRRNVMEIQKQLLSKQADDASFLRRFEIVTAVFVLLMVSAALIYGRKIKSNMETSANEKEVYIAELQNTQQLLQKAQDELELKVEERTAELSSSKDLVENIITSMADMMIVVDDKGVIQMVNQATLNLLGYRNEEMVDKEVKILTQEETFLTENEFDEMIRQRKVIEIEKDFVRKNGTKIRVSVSSSVLRGKRHAAVVVAKDISKRIEDEKILRNYSQKLEQSNEELQVFAYVASHDLNEPLRKVQAFGDRLDRKYSDSLGEEGRGYISRMQQASSRMQTLINGLLEYSRVSSKVQEFVLTDLTKICYEVISDLEVRIEQTNAKVEIGKLPIIEADPLQMRQLFQNLISNALKFQGEGETPIVKVYSKKSNDTYEIYVEDNGIGFEEKYLEKIFAVFQRLHGRTQYEGSGIGLSVCKKIVSRHQGDITAKSKL